MSGKILIDLQKEILKSVRAEVRKVLGPQPRSIKKYYEAYKREFRGNASIASKEELLREVLDSDIILYADYHTFDKSQKTALKLLSEIHENEQPVVLALELVPRNEQKTLTDYLADRLSEEDFLKAIRYEKTWGFPWENFKIFFDFAKEHSIPVLALNESSAELNVRDQAAAETLAQAISEDQNNSKFFVVYGDLHLAKSHLPKALKKELQKIKIRKKILTIFQNSERLYWELAEKNLSHTVDVLNLHKNRYCLMTAAPWVKLHSYLEWATSQQVFNSDDEKFTTVHEFARDQLSSLANALRVDTTSYKELDFTIHSVNDLRFLDNLSSLPHFQGMETEAIKHYILANKTCFVSECNLIYLPSHSINAINEAVALALHSYLSQTSVLYSNPHKDFFASILSSTLMYFGSKLLNHKRRCDLEDDFKLYLEHEKTGTRLLQETIQARSARFIMKHLSAQKIYLKEGIYKAPISSHGRYKTQIFLESTRSIGYVLGEKLHLGFAEGHIPVEYIEVLFRTGFAKNPRNARSHYLDLVKTLADITLPYSSKRDRF